MGRPHRPLNIRTSQSVDYTALRQPITAFRRSTDSCARRTHYHFQGSRCFAQKIADCRWPTHAMINEKSHPSNLNRGMQRRGAGFRTRFCDGYRREAGCCGNEPAAVSDDSLRQNNQPVYQPIENNREDMLSFMVEDERNSSASIASTWLRVRVGLIGSATSPLMEQPQRLSVAFPVSLPTAGSFRS